MGVRRRCCSAISRSPPGRSSSATAGVGPVAAGFWRLALALPFLWLIARMLRQPVHLPRARADHRHRLRRLLLRRRPRRLARRDPADQARQRDPVRQYLELHLRRLGPVAGAPLAVAGAGAGAGARRGSAARLLMWGSAELSAAHLARRPARGARRAALHRLSDPRRTHPRRARSRCPCCSSPACSARRCCFPPRSPPASDHSRRLDRRCSRSPCAARSSGRGCWSMRSAMSRRWSSASPC